MRAPTPLATVFGLLVTALAFAASLPGCDTGDPAPPASPIPTATVAAPIALDEAAAGRFAALALACVHQEYPNKIAHVLNSPADVQAPSELTPAFYGCYDWHSSVHGHWLLARLAREFPSAPFAADALAALETSITPERIAGEVAYLNREGMESFERPYGLAWLLQLAAELRESSTPDAAALDRKSVV